MEEESLEHAYRLTDEADAYPTRDTGPTQAWLIGVSCNVAPKNQTNRATGQTSPFQLLLSQA